MNTIESTLENNKLIAEFMGSNYINEPYTDKEGITHDFYCWTKPSCNYPKSIGIGELSTAWQIGNFHFHNDWNWLMQVVEMIESLEYDVNIEFATCIILKNVDDFKPIFGHGSNFSKIEAVYNACLEFIKWYNENKQD